MFFDLVQKFVLLGAAVCLLGFFSFTFRKTLHGFNGMLNRHRGNKLVRCANNLGPWLYYNEVGRTTAVCMTGDFKDTASKQTDVKPWEPLKQVRVRPTFVFCKDELARTKMHVMANEEEIKSMIDELVLKLTGYRKNQVDKASFERASKMLIRENKQLFVPFASNLSDEEGKKQMDFYGSTNSLHDVKRYLIG